MSIRIRDVVELVCTRLDLSHDELRSSSREKHVAEARALVYLLARRHTRMGWKAIARYSTGKDASTARFQGERLSHQIGLDPGLATAVVELDQALVRLAEGTRG